MGNEGNFSAMAFTFRLVPFRPANALQSRRIDLAAGPASVYLAASLHWIDVSQTEDRRQAKLTGRDRVLLIASAAGLLLLLVVAALVEPDPRGFGTHQRFGLPPCSVRVLFGIRCPTCGMTTAWSRLVRGQVTGAFRANVGGTVMGMLAVPAAAWFLLCAGRGRWVGWAPNNVVVASGALVIGLITIVDWAVRLIAG